MSYGDPLWESLWDELTRTTDELIIYCLLIMEAEHEALLATRVRTFEFVRPDAQDVVNALAARARETDPNKTGTELDHSVQFSEAIRNPIVRAGVNNAAVNRWGLSEENRKKIEKAGAENTAGKG